MGNTVVKQYSSSESTVDVSLFALHLQCGLDVPLNPGNLPLTVSEPTQVAIRDPCRVHGEFQGIQEIWIVAQDFAALLLRTVRCLPELWSNSSLAQPDPDEVVNPRALFWRTK